MKVRDKENPNAKMSSGKFNTHALGEVICYWADPPDCDLMFCKDLDVFVEANGIGWKDMRQAFKDKDIITDNYNTYFFEPKTEEDRERGFTL